jgi:hypothetical protein
VRMILEVAIGTILMTDLVACSNRFQRLPLILPWRVHCAGVMSSAVVPVDIIPDSS